jgi:hypothetical protein
MELINSPRRNIMLKIWVTLLTVSLFSFQVLSSTRLECHGTHKGIPILISGEVPGLIPSEMIEATGHIEVDGRVVTSFNQSDVKFNIFLMTFEAKNNHGDLVQGRVTDVKNMRALIRRLYVYGHGIDFTNISIRCD